MSSASDLVRRGLRLEYVTLGWNVLGTFVVAWAAIAARSVSLAGFGLDSVIEIGASAVVVWELSGTGAARRGRALRLIGAAFVLLAVYLAAQSTVVLLTAHHAEHSPAGIAWTALTAAVMFGLAAAKTNTGAALDNEVLRTEGRVTFVDGVLATACWSGSSSTPWRVGGGRTLSRATCWSITRPASRGRSSRTDLRGVLSNWRRLATARSTTRPGGG